MWREIATFEELNLVFESMYHFHDSCIKEIKYVSGAYVDTDLGMYPINDKRKLSIIVQRQFQENSMIEIEFEGLIRANIVPVNPSHTCEILDSKMFLTNNSIVWCDSEYVTEDNYFDYDGMLICAERMKWREVTGFLGKDDYYIAKYS